MQGWAVVYFIVIKTTVKKWQRKHSNSAFTQKELNFTVVVTCHEKDIV